MSDNSNVPVRVAIFSGTSKVDNMYSVREFGNQCLLYSLDDAFREAIINAFKKSNGEVRRMCKVAERATK